MSHFLSTGTEAERSAGLSTFIFHTVHCTELLKVKICLRALFAGGGQGYFLPWPFPKGKPRS